jgi:N6-adenosine-specific RNA methylase IME4
MTAELAPVGTQLALPGLVTAVGLTLPEGLSFETWDDIGRGLSRVERSILWWVGDWVRYGARSYGETYRTALEATDYTKQTLADAKWVAEAIETSRRREILSWSHHREVAPLEPDAQDYWLDQAQEHEWSSRELRQQLRATNRPRFAAVDVPVGEFSVLYADPPWRYEFSETDTRAIENQYPTLPLEDILALAVPAAEDCVLFLWATSPKLADSLEVVDAWGFTYRTCMVWVKDKIGMGYYARQRHELLLVAVRGEPGVPAEADRPDSVIASPRLARHSGKPEAAYELIERMYPDRPRCELFARNTRAGWASWGNEVAACPA